MTLLTQRRLALIAIAAGFLLLLVSGIYLYRLSTIPPQRGSPNYERYAEAFQVGVAALDADLIQVAEKNLTQAVTLIPQEPAGWADRGLLYLRTGRLPQAAKDLEEASRLAPRNAEVQKLLGLLRQRQGQFAAAAAHLRLAIERNPDDIKTIYLLAKIIDQEQQEGSDAEYQRLLERILAVRDKNLRVLVERLRVAVRRSDETAIRDTLRRFEELAPTWQERTRVTLADLEKELSQAPGPSAVPRLLRFSNVILAERAFPSSVAEVETPEAFVGDSLQSFLWMDPVRHSPAPPDTQLRFTADELAAVPAGKWEVVLPIWLTSEGPPTVFMANGTEIRGGEKIDLASIPLSPEGLVALDWNNDLQTDIVLAGAGGLRFYLQQKAGTFVDTTAKTKLPPDVEQAAYHGALAADVDLDGDLDLVLARETGAPVLLRNNFDDTFTAQPIFDKLNGPQSITLGDFDHDGAPDAALLDAKGTLHVFTNQRSGQFQEWAAKPPGDRLLALTSADVNDDGVLDLVVLREDGMLLALSDQHKQSAWQVTDLGRWDQVVIDKQMVVSTLLTQDFDNNGVLDILASGPQHSSLWLGSGGGQFCALPVELPPRLMAAVDLENKGRIDLLGLDQTGRLIHLRNAGRKSYHWQTIRPQAARGDIDGDNRINSFGIGGEIEIRAGTHVVKQAIRTPAVHFGLGDRERADLFRVQWPNGTFQFEFTPPIDLSVVAVQRLKGSCPFLFAWNGERFTFVTDFMWSTPLGMYINASDKGGFLQTTDWVKIPGEQLVAKDGHYDLRVNANLWETHFFDHMTLMAIDHPAETEMYVDERFFMEPTPPTVLLTDAPRSVALAKDHTGRDVTSAVAANDETYHDPGKRGRYQGVMDEHWVEVDLGEHAPATGPLWLLARGWMHPTDSSVNYALEQGEHIKPRGLVLDVPDGQGGWKVARDRLGFPAGKNKTVLLRLDGLGGGAEIPRRFRLRTNLEICWDSLQIARGRDDIQPQRQMLQPEVADLRFRGILAMTQANPSSPELPHYDEIVARGQYWRDLIGYHTRYGDVTELLHGVDDRYAILCGGDEVIFQFKTPADTPAGWKRDFVWVADGWVKDGDYNTRFGKTVLPLPAHDMQTYDTPPKHLEDDPIYKRFPKDWEIFHTRYVTPHFYEQGLRNFRLPPERSDRSSP